ncbi:MAG: hypothetical protein GZ086_01365 [Gelidibacter sp.]|nr:hypothetical protein [Gelidibacter sp.]
MKQYNSFVGNFNDKRINIYILKELLEVNYQFDSLLELINFQNLSENFEFNILNKFILIIKNSKEEIYLVLSNDFKTIKCLNKLIRYSNKENSIIVFDSTIVLKEFNNVHYINQEDWMNRIISNGINQNILNLQFIRDLDFRIA